MEQIRKLKKRQRSIDMEQKKYKLTKETMCFDGVTLHRIQAIKDFGDVTAGEYGGWVESERNLSQEGNCWITMEAKAYGYAEICDNAVLTCGAIACENSTIGNDTFVTDESVIRGFTYLFGNVEVSGESVIDGYARLHGHVMVHTFMDILRQTEKHISQMVPRCVRQMITSSLRTFGVPEGTLHGPVQTINGTLGVFVVLVKS